MLDNTEPCQRVWIRRREKVSRTQPEIRHCRRRFYLWVEFSESVEVLSNCIWIEPVYLFIYFENKKNDVSKEGQATMPTMRGRKRGKQVTCLRCCRRMSGVVVLLRVMADFVRRTNGELADCSPGVITWLGRASITRSRTAAAAKTTVHLDTVAIALVMLVTAPLVIINSKTKQKRDVNKMKNVQHSLYVVGAISTFEEIYSRRRRFSSLVRRVDGIQPDTSERQDG